MSTLPEPQDIHTRYDRLVSWAREHGAFVHPSMKFTATENDGVEAIIDPEGAALEPYETFLTVPYNLTFSYLNAVSAGKPDSGYHPHGVPLPEKFLETFVDHDVLNAVFLVQQYLLGQESFWYPYIQILPRPQDTGNPAIPLLWSEDDLYWLQGTHLDAEVPKKQLEIESRWDQAMQALSACNFDHSEYTPGLGMWAYYIFVARSFPAIAISGGVDGLKEEYQALVATGVNLDDSPKVLLPVLDSLNHAQNTSLEWDLGTTCLGMAKVLRILPGEQLLLHYDKDTQRFNNTALLRDFGFVLPQNECPELVIPFPFDLSKPAHPSHVVFSTASTVEEYYASSEETFFAFVTVRAPLRHPYGLMNPTHPVRALRHFHPKLVSMVSFRVSTLIERASLRNSPYEIPSKRNERATVQFLTTCLQTMLDDLKEGPLVALKPCNYRQCQAALYRAEQVSILQDVLKDMAKVW